MTDYNEYDASKLPTEAVAVLANLTADVANLLHRDLRALEDMVQAQDEEIQRLAILVDGWVSDGR